MIKKHLKMIAVCSIAIAALFAVNPIEAHAEWRQDNIGWWYPEGNSWVTGWRQIDGKWYYFDSKGYMVTDRFIDNCYLNRLGYWDGLTQSFSVKYPSSWIKSTSPYGNTFYKLDNKGTIVTSQTENMYGLSIQKCNDINIKVLKNTGADKVDTSEQVINGRTVYVSDCKFKKGDNFEVEHRVVFYNDNKDYVFAISGIVDISSANMDSFNEMLKTVTF